MSVYSESDAANRWCPWVRVPVWPAAGSVPIAANREGKLLNDPGTLARCLGSQCMAWRWQLDINQRPTSLGYCGIAGDSVPGQPSDFLFQTSPGAVSLTSGQAADVMSYSVPPGDWDLFGDLVLSGTSTSISQIEFWLNTASLTPPAANTFAFVQQNVGLAGQTGVATGSQIIAGPARLVTAAPMLVYLSCIVVFSRDTVSATATLRGRRLSSGGGRTGSITPPAPIPEQPPAKQPQPAARTRPERMK